MSADWTIPPRFALRGNSRLGAAQRAHWTTLRASRSGAIRAWERPSALIRSLRRLAVLAGVLVACHAPLAPGETKGAASDAAAKVVFGGVEYAHRWSKDGQNEYTPPGDADLSRWQDMVTLNVHETVRNGDQLAEVANRVLGNYQKHGKIVRTDSKPRTAERPAEHLVVALLGNPNFIEAAFTRFALRDGSGMVIVYSHRIYGKDAAAPMGEWLKSKGPGVEKALMAWDAMPPLAALKALPQSK